MSALTYFEIHGEERAKLAEFYRNLFGLQVDQAPGIDDWRIQTGASDCEVDWRVDVPPHS
jgi:predicted enzyme related to lactoylglutathione lyase